MTDVKHFTYEGHVEFKAAKSEMKVLDIDFLTPAKVKLMKDGVEISLMVSVDIINRKVYDKDGQLFMSDEIFTHLDSVNTLPEDFFIAPDEVLQQAAQADLDHQQVRKEVLGEYNG